jgi:hypothetical protein
MRMTRIRAVTGLTILLTIGGATLPLFSWLLWFFPFNQEDAFHFGCL